MWTFIGPRFASPGWNIICQLDARILGNQLLFAEKNNVMLRMSSTTKKLFLFVIAWYQGSRFGKNAQERPVLAVWCGNAYSESLLQQMRSGLLLQRNVQRQWSVSTSSRLPNCYLEEDMFWMRQGRQPIKAVRKLSASLVLRSCLPKEILAHTQSFLPKDYKWDKRNVC